MHRTTAPKPRSSSPRRPATTKAEPVDGTVVTAGPPRLSAVARLFASTQIQPALDASCTALILFPAFSLRMAE